MDGTRSITLSNGRMAPEAMPYMLISPTAAALGADATAAELTLRHGFTLVLGLSVLTLLAGCGVFAVRRRLVGLPARCRVPPWRRPRFTSTRWMVCWARRHG